MAQDAGTSPAVATSDGIADGAADVLIDCDTCRMREIGCADCVVGLMLGPPEQERRLDSEERYALAVLAHSGLLPPLRLVPTSPPGRARSA